jgi:hypothetical protein
MSYKPPSMRNKVPPPVRENSAPFRNKVVPEVKAIDLSETAFPALGNQMIAPKNNVTDYKKIVPILLQKEEKDEEEDDTKPLVFTLPKFKLAKKFVEEEEEDEKEEEEQPPPAEDEWQYVTYNTRRRKRVDSDNESVSSSESEKEEESVWNDEPPSHETTWD